MEFSVFSIHAGVGGASLGRRYYYDVCAAGGAVVAKSVNDAGIVMDAAQVAEQYPGRKHTIVMRWTNPGPPPASHDIPNYANEPQQEARSFMDRIRWNVDRAPELDPLRGQIYLQIGNEPRTHIDYDSPNWGDMHPVEWLAVWGKACAEIAIQWGFKVVLFGFNVGTPEPEDWARPYMLELLRWIASLPAGQVILGCNEGCHDNENNYFNYRITPAEQYSPYWIGRATYCVATCNAREIRPPQFAATEWAWNYRDMPSHEKAVADLDWTNPTYLRLGYRAAFLWATQTSEHIGDLQGKMTGFIPTLQQYNLDRRWTINPSQFTKVVNLLPQNTTLAEKNAIVAAIHDDKQTILQSADDCADILTLDNVAPDSKAVVWGAERWDASIESWLRDRGVANVELRAMPTVRGLNALLSRRNGR